MIVPFSIAPNPDKQRLTHKNTILKTKFFSSNGGWICFESQSCTYCISVSIDLDALQFGLICTVSQQINSPHFGRIEIQVGSDPTYTDVTIPRFRRGISPLVNSSQVCCSQYGSALLPQSTFV